MRMNKLIAAACMSAMLLAGCSASNDTTSANTETTAADTTSTKTSDKTAASSTSSAAKDKTTAAKDTTTSVSNTTDTSAATTTSNAKLDKITTDLKGKGYRIQKDYVDWDNGINASTVKQELECEGVNDYNIWEFNSDADASASFDNIESHEKLDAENTVTRDGNLITVKDRDDSDVEYYVLSGNLIVESDSATAPATFQGWGLM